jgi:tetratricopeptide (TPR) repeat protein
MIDKLFNTSIEQFGASEENKNRYLGMSKQFQGEAYYKQGNIAQMYNYLEQAKAYYKNLPIELTGLLQIKADLSNEVNDLDISALSIDEGLEIAENQELSRQKERFLRTKMEVLKKKGDEEGALKANEQLLLINQKKVSSQNRNLLINMELREQLRIK